MQHVTDAHEAEAASLRGAPLRKRWMRRCWRLLPRTRWSFNVGKLLTRTVLKPESHSHPVRAQFAGRIPMVLDLGSFVPNDLYCLDDHFESITLRRWRRLAREASVVLDIGSHIGTFALVAADANPRARVLAVEVDATNHRYLASHSARYPNVVPVRAAIADRAGTMWFCPGGANDGGGRVCAERPADPGSYEVETRSLSELCRQHQIGRVDLMKIDVEGFEHVLLTRDDEFWLHHAPTHLFVELTIDKSNRGPTERVLQVMRDRGYEVRRIQGLYSVPFGKPHDLANWYFRRAAAVTPR